MRKGIGSSKHNDRMVGGGVPGSENLLKLTGTAKTKRFRKMVAHEVKNLHRKGENKCSVLFILTMTLQNARVGCSMDYGAVGGCVSSESEGSEAA